jgi:hypothetical protein
MPGYVIFFYYFPYMVWPDDIDTSTCFLIFLGVHFPVKKQNLHVYIVNDFFVKYLWTIWNYADWNNCHWQLIVDWLLLIVLCPAQKFFTHGDVTIAGKGLQNLGLDISAQGLWTGRGINTCIVTLGLDFFGLISRTTPHSYYTQRECWGPFLTWMLVDPHSVSS